MFTEYLPKRRNAAKIEERLNNNCKLVVYNYFYNKNFIYFLYQFLDIYFIIVAHLSTLTFCQECQTSKVLNIVVDCFFFSRKCSFGGFKTILRAIIHRRHGVILKKVSLIRTTLITFLNYSKNLRFAFFFYFRNNLTSFWVIPNYLKSAGVLAFF